MRAIGATPNCKEYTVLSAITVEDPLFYCRIARPQHGVSQGVGQ